MDAVMRALIPLLAALLIGMVLGYRCASREPPSGEDWVTALEAQLTAQQESADRMRVVIDSFAAEAAVLHEHAEELEAGWLEDQASARAEIARWRAFATRVRVDTVEVPVEVIIDAAETALVRCEDALESADSTITVLRVLATLEARRADAADERSEVLEAYRLELAERLRQIKPPPSHTRSVALGAAIGAVLGCYTADRVVGQPCAEGVVVGALAGGGGGLLVRLRM